VKDRRRLVDQFLWVINVQPVRAQADHALTQ
jgi:hypothetical protein